MSSAVDFRNECKFAFLGLTTVRAEIPNAGVTLPDGTEVVTALCRAVFSEWPTGWRESLERRYAGGASSTFHAVGFRA